MGDFAKALTSLIGTLKAKIEVKIGILQKEVAGIGDIVTDLSQKTTETVLYTPQDLSDDQKRQARDNIGVQKEVLKVTFTENTNGWISADITFEDIAEAYKEGWFLFGDFNHSIYYVDNWSPGTRDYKFRKYKDPTDVIYWFEAMYTWQHYTDDWNGRLVPKVTTSDNGKFLQVVNGAWAAAEIQDANGEEF